MDAEHHMRVVPVDDEEQPNSLLDQLAEKRRVVSETRETFIPVVGYDKDPPILLIGYRLLDGPEIEKIGQNIRTEFRNRWQRSLYAAVDLFIAATTGLYVLENDAAGNKPVPVTIAGEPVLGFTADLARALKFADKLADPDRPRDVVFGLFGNNDVAISQHNWILNRWMADTSLDVSRELLEGNL